MNDYEILKKWLYDHKNIDLQVDMLEGLLPEDVLTLMEEYGKYIRIKTKCEKIISDIDMLDKDEYTNLMKELEDKTDIKSWLVDPFEFYNAEDL